MKHGEGNSHIEIHCGFSYNMFGDQTIFPLFCRSRILLFLYIFAWLNHPFARSNPHSCRRKSKICRLSPIFCRNISEQHLNFCWLLVLHTMWASTVVSRSGGRSCPGTWLRGSCPGCSGTSSTCSSCGGLEVYQDGFLERPKIGR